MKDTHETNLPAEETGKLEKTKAPGSDSGKHCGLKLKQLKPRRKRQRMRSVNYRKKKFLKN